MTKPPDDPYDDVLSQVSDALDALNLGNGDARENLLEGVRDALKAIEGIDFGTDESLFYETGEVAPDGSPKLRVVDTEEAEFHEAQHAAAEFRTVKVLKPGRASAQPAPLNLEGTITLEVRPGETAAWQTVFRGDTARAYRIRCTSGILQIAVDGAVVEQLHHSQTVDVEARLIRVSCGSDGACQGRYARL